MATLNRLRFVITFQRFRRANGITSNKQSCKTLYQQATLNSCVVPGRSCTLYSQGMKDICHCREDLTLKGRYLCSVTSGRLCWSCGHTAELFFCSFCNIIQPPDGDTNYFHMLNCEQKFSLDTQQLQKRYVELQRSLHPDNFSQKSMKEQEFSETQSALVNRAYRTLQKPLSRAVYMLELQGVLLEEGTDDTADPAFLLKVMEVNESLAETQNQDEVHAIGQSVREKLKDLTEQMNSSLNKGDLLTAKGLLVQMKYFTNIEEKVKRKITESW